MSDLCSGNATHELLCSHAIGRRAVSHYCMRCHVLKVMPDGRLKVRVYGERNWKGKEDKWRIRYVDSDRVTKLKKRESDR